MAAQKERCYSARTLYEMYKDGSNLLYFNFLKPILKEVTDINLLFQSTNSDITKVYGDLKLLLVSVVKRIIKPSFLRYDIDMCPNALLIDEIDRISKALSNPHALLPLESVDFGFAFTELAKKNIVSPEDLKSVQNRCFAFMLRLCEELLKRLPHNTKTIQKLRYFDPKMVFSPISPRFIDLPLELLRCSTDIEILEIQWRNLTSLRYSDICDSSIPIQEKNTQEFWVDVLNIKETGGKKKFEDLALFVLQILSLPLSNAIVERVFSVMNCVKSKLRNRMQVDMLQAILRIRLHLNASKICCKSFKPTETMFHKFTSDMYDSPKITTSESESVDSATTLDEVMDIFISEGAQEINLYD
ncbi:uncharacterized protein LOC114130437 isoform X2 [Aphis gossypii]|uniref:uncharacterized protein LOC114130437 isoform X2 n=1 Tax=Aphis gossypii TaxID=80765 RepID=UPI002158AE84|nr:uncharacterized protein LOC114130437 isoform X2 [Aphis gossypii]